MYFSVYVENDGANPAATLNINTGKVIIHKSLIRVSLVEKDTIENVSWPI